MNSDQLEIKILKFDSIDSTNTSALEQARRGVPEGLCILAREQTAGRGRHGRTWVSEKDAGLFFSIVLRPRNEIRFLPLLTLMTAVAVFETLRNKYGLEPDIKWSNDVLINGKKICGILAETADTQIGLAVIIGIGINLNSKNFPAGLTDKATSIEEETGRPADPDELLQELINFLRHFYQISQKTEGPEKIRSEWARRSSFFKNKQVRVRLENETYTGTTDGLEENGALRIKTESGDLKIVQAGDVESLRPR